MNKRMKVDWPIIEKGSYEQFKNQAMALVRLPKIGVKYRVLNDEFAEVWVLVTVAKAQEVWFPPFGLRRRTSTLTATVPLPRLVVADNVYTFCFANIKQLSDDTIYVSDAVRITCLLSEWSEKMDAGEIVEEGYDLPPGKVRDWACNKGVRYVLQFDAEALAKFMCRGAINSIYESEEHYDRARESHATRLSTRSFERVRRTLFRRALANQVGATVHRQYRPKIP